MHNLLIIIRYYDIVKSKVAKTYNKLLFEYVRH